jgi:hypothetical protein
MTTNARANSEPQARGTRKLWRLIAVAALVTGVVIPAAVDNPARADEVTMSQGQLRTGWDPSEPALAPSTVRGGTFGKLFGTSVTGQVYAQPIVAGNSVIVATEEDNVYSLNAETGAINWQLNLGPAWPSTVNGCADLTPDIGVTSTPVYDPSSGEVYVSAVVNDGPSLYQPHVYLVAINVQTGQKDWQTPMQGAPVNDPTRPFDPLTERQRASLLLMNGEVYMGFSAYCDFSPYVGYVAGVNTSSHAVSLWSSEAGLTDNQGGIWHSDGGLMSDGPGRIFATSGNGVSPAPGPGTSPPSELAESVIRLGVRSDGSLAAQDFFSPSNAPQLDAADQDLGSGGPVALPFGTTTHPNLLLQAGKDGRLFVLDRDNLGGRGAATDHPVTVNGPYQGQWGHPAAFAGSGGNDFVYYLGKGDFLRALKFDTSTAKLTDAGNSPGTFPYGSGSPVVTSNGADPASAVVWVVDRNGTSSTLDAFAGLPAAGKLTLLWSAPIGTATKFTVAATDNGRVYVGTLDGKVYGFGSPDLAPLTGPPASFGQVAVGAVPSPSQTVTVTAQTTVTVTGDSVSSPAATDPFSAGIPNESGIPVTFPVTLNKGDQLSVPVTFAPNAPGGVTGSLNFATNTANFSTVSVSLSGTGTQAGYYASPTSLQFGVVPIGGSSPTLQTVITNGGTQAESWSTISAPADTAFTVSGQPAAGTSIAPGQSVSLNVTYTPATTTGDSGSLTEPSSLGGTSATVSLTGTGETGQGALTASPAPAAFGNVALGQQASQPVDVTNTGNLPMRITGFTAPGAPFGTPEPVMTGLSLTPGSDIQFPVTFTPQSESTTTGTYTLTATDGRNPPRTLTIGVSGTGVAPVSGIAVPSPGGGWTLNGNARMTGTTLRLTPAVNGEKGSAVYYQPLASNGLHARFTTRIGGGTGADGMTFSLLDASGATPRALGNGGGSLGFGGLPGVAVALDSYPSNFIGLATGSTSTGLTFAAKNTKVPSFRSGTHAVDVSVSGSTIKVSVDGTQYLSASVTLPPQVLAAFTGATGGLNDLHAVSGVSVSSGSVALPPPGGGWSYNRSAVMSGSDTRLTQAVTGQDGSVIYPVAVPSSGLQAAFNMQIGGGTGADGMTFALLSPSTAVSATGASGSALGFGGLTGVAVTFDTHAVSGYPSSNFVGIATGLVMPGELKFAGTVREIAPIRSGTHDVVVTVTGSVLTVYFDGVQVLQNRVAVPSKALLAFTGSDGALTDIHAIRNAAISAP